MARLLFPLLLIFCPFISVQSQNYRPLLQPERDWVVAVSYAYEQCSMYFPPWADCQTRARYFLQGDTLLQGQVYQKCYREDFSLSSSWAGPFEIGAPMYVGAMREDTISRRVFGFNSVTSADILLYDFSLEQGDTATIYLGAFLGDNSPNLIQIDTVYTLPDGRKKWIYNQYQEIVEGVGTGNGLFPTYLCFEVCSYLACMHEQGQAVFDINNWPFQFFNGGPICDYVLSAQNTELLPLKVSHQPGTGLFEIEGLPSGVLMRVFNMQGQLVCIPENTGLIDLSGQANGVYVLQISGKTNGSVKLVKD